MYRLGAQGRNIQKQLEQKVYNVVQTFEVEPTSVSQEQRDVENFILLLKNQSSTYDKITLLSYCVNFFPKIKNRDNLKLISKLFFNNQIIFNSTNIEFEKDYSTIEAIASIFERKLKISEPTLSAEKFFHIFITQLYENQTLIHWQKLLVVTGINLSKSLSQILEIPESRKFFQKIYESLSQFAQGLINSFFHDSINNFDIIKLVIVSTSLSLSSNFPKNAKLPFDILTDLGTIILIEDKPSPSIWKNLNKISFLIEYSITNNVTFKVLDINLNRILQFTKNLSQSKSRLSIDDLKFYYFSIISIFQGCIKLGLNIYNKLSKPQLFSIYTIILRSLNELNFVLIKLGTSGFKNFNFVYLNSINGCLDISVPNFEKFISELLKQSNEDPIKLLFILGIIEHLVKFCCNDYYKREILPLLERYLLSPVKGDPFILKLTIESCHQVVISNFKQLQNLRLEKFTYLRICINQYLSNILSLNQFIIIVQQLSNSDLNDDEINQILHMLYLSFINNSFKSDLPNEKEPINQISKIGLFKVIISVIPYIQSPYILQNWLENIEELLEIIPSQQFKIELSDYIWEVISNDLNIIQTDIAVNWWYKLVKRSTNSHESKI
ncbi:hypothetical protein WICMUC_001525 [Wickerhamomyces mucosus]|uniref:Peroxisomal biogenesis factor 8 n=1 Tax=Wickerhamomyces mucosus TaxID=1378264 RepID=A0A9P8PU84_9ASCO|nr:hypothetical protein WICMUC_001525 [Wickerhamomyces mucosus]